MSDRYQSLLLFGPPGVGKGTQGKLLGSIPGFVHLATGDIFRALDKNSELGQQFMAYSSRGELVPDELTIKVWRNHVEHLMNDGCFDPERDVLVLDGIPRSLNQAKTIGEHIDVLAVIHLECPDINEMITRMKRRAEQQGRHDDADENVVRKRFEVYKDETAPVLSCYDASLVTKINPIGTPAEVLMNILKVVVPIYSKNFANPLA
ncbi:MAG: nucleoside monophosphate kinase [Phycisphaerales bacterium]|nr:MAG: nucleoside monophosphate kinase [Phycisphaerales bacterium]